MTEQEFQQEMAAREQFALAGVLFEAAYMRDEPITFVGLIAQFERTMGVTRERARVIARDVLDAVETCEQCGRITKGCDLTDCPDEDPSVGYAGMKAVCHRCLTHRR